MVNQGCIENGREVGREVSGGSATETKKLVTVSNVFSMSSCASSGGRSDKCTCGVTGCLGRTGAWRGCLSGGGTLLAHTPRVFISRGTEPGANM